MDEEMTVDRGAEEVDEVTDAYHRTKIAAEGEPVDIEITDVSVEKHLKRVRFRAEYANEETEFRVDSGKRKYASQIRPFDVPDGADSLEALVGTEQTFRFDGESNSLVDPDTMKIVATRPKGSKREGDTDEFWRHAKIESELVSRPGQPRAELSVTGDHEEVVLSAEIGGEVVEWTLGVPSPMDFDGSPLQSIVDGLGAGDPKRLDGDDVRVCMTYHSDEYDVESYQSDDGAVSILANEPETSEDDSVEVDDTQSEGDDNEDTSLLMSPKLVVMSVLLGLGLFFPMAVAIVLNLRLFAAALQGLAMSTIMFGVGLSLYQESMTE